MATKEFKARLVNKIDTYANWTSNDPVLLKGEIAIVDVPASTDVVQQEPAVLMKIGDGTKKFSELPWISAKSADVYSWALAPTKPTYQASEIEGLDAYIFGKKVSTEPPADIKTGDIWFQVTGGEIAQAYTFDEVTALSKTFADIDKLGLTWAQADEGGW